MSSLRASAILAAIVLGCAGSCAIEVQAATRSAEHVALQFLEGDFDGMALDSLGELVVAPVASERWETAGLYAWCMALDAQKRLIVGTGDGGTLYREASGELREWADTLALEILSLLVDGNAVLAGSSPDGVVYRVSGDGRVSIELDLPQQSVWTLAPGSVDGSWLAGTGPGARIFRGGRGSEAGEELHRLAATNTTVLLRDGGALWVATQGPGLVYRIEGSDTAAPQLRYEAPQDEVRALVADGSGGVYALSVETGRGNGRDKGARITWLPARGAAETVWEGDSALISLVRTADGDFLAGEAETGRVLRIDREGRLGLWVELDGGDPLALLARGDDTFVATGNLGAVFRLKAPGGDRGSFEGPVISAPRCERWGRLVADALDGQVRFSTRSGVRAEPDETWSEWSDFARTGAAVRSPPAPYLQYRLQVEGTAVSAVRVSWAERNLAPRVRKLKVEAPGGDLSLGSLNSSPPQVSQRFDDGLVVEYQVYQERKRAEPDAVAWARGLRSIVWEAEDPNEDELHYRVETRRLPRGDWGLLADAHPERILAWDTRAVEDGHYRVRVTATDAPSHPVGEAREGAWTSAVVHVDNSSPRLAGVQSRGDQVVFELEDAASPLVEAAWRLDDGDWIALVPLDGVIDASRERFTLPREAVGDRARIWVRAADAAGNVLVRQITAGELR